VAASLYGMAGLYAAEGRYADAEALTKRALAIYEEMFGQNHPDVALALHALANVYAAQGKYIEAQRLQERAVAIYEKGSCRQSPR